MKTWLKNLVSNLGDVILDIEDLILEWIKKLRSAKMLVTVVLLFGYFYLLLRMLPIILSNSIVAIFAISVTGTLVTGVVVWFFKLRKDEKSPLMNLIPKSMLDSVLGEDSSDSDDD